MKCEYSKRECFYTPVATAFSCYLCAVHDAYNQGTADANANRPHGEWKPDGTCSECGVYSSLNKDTAYFCPNCGADMRDKKDDLAEIIEAVQSIKEGDDK